MLQQESEIYLFYNASLAKQIKKQDKCTGS